MKSVVSLTMTLAALAATSEAEEALSLLQLAAVKQHISVLPDSLPPHEKRPCGNAGERPGSSQGLAGNHDCQYMGQWPDIEQVDVAPPQGSGKPLEECAGGQEKDRLTGKSVNIRTLPDPKKKSKYFQTPGQPNLGVNLRDKDAVDFQCKGGKGKWFYTQSYNGPGGTDVDLTYNYGKIQEVATAADTGFKHARAYKIIDGKWMKNPDTGVDMPPDRPQLINLGPVKDEKDCVARAMADAKCHESVEGDLYTQAIWETDASGQKKQPRNENTYLNPDGPLGNVLVLYNTVSKSYFMNQGGNRCGCAVTHGGSTIIEAAHPGGNPGTWVCQLSAADMGIEIIETDDGKLKVGKYEVPEPGSKPEKAPKEPKEKEDFSCDLCEESDNDFDPTGKKGKCERIHERAQKNSKRCEKRKSRPGVIRGCCPDGACKSARETSKDALDAKRAAKKAVTDAKDADASREELKTLRAKLKAARTALKAARANKQSVCGTRKKKEA